MAGGRQEVLLGRAPKLAALYGAALGNQAQAVVVKKRQRRELSQVEYVLPELSVEREHLTAHQRLLGMRTSDLLNPGFVHVLAFPVAVALMARADFPLPLLGMVHLENRVEQHSALQLDDRLQVRAWAENLRGHRAGTAVDLICEVASVRDHSVAWRGVSTYLAKGVFLFGKDTLPDDAPRPTFAAPTPTGTWQLPQNLGRQYAKVSGDYNPIHLANLGAKAFGFKRTIIHGMYTATRALVETNPDLGGPLVWSAQFASPVLLPSRPAVALQREVAAGGAAAGGSADSFAAEMVVWDAKRERLHLQVTVTAP